MILSNRHGPRQPPNPTPPAPRLLVMNALPTGTVTFLFSDVEGSTQLVRTAGGAYAGLIADVRRLLRSEIAANGGAEVDATGDEISAVFQEVQPALSAALAGQEQIRDHPWPDGIAVKVRMGLHTGLPHLGDEGYTGLDVIRASRIAAAGHGGQVLLSSTAAPFVTEVETRDLGTHRLQGLPDPEAIHQVLADGLPRDFPPLRGTVSQLGDARRVVLADDSVLLREGVARLLEEAGFEVVAQSGDGGGPSTACRDAQARRRGHRHPDAADAHRRGAAGGAGDPRHASRGRRPPPLAVRRARLCDGAARVERRGRRLPAEGPRRRPRAVRHGRPTGRGRRLCPRPRRRQRAGRAEARETTRSTS